MTFVIPFGSEISYIIYLYIIDTASVEYLFLGDQGIIVFSNTASQVQSLYAVSVDNFKIQGHLVYKSNKFLLQNHALIN